MVKFCNSEQLKQDRTKKLYLSTRWEPHLQIDGKFTTKYGNRIRYTQAGVIDQIWPYFWARSTPFLPKTWKKFAITSGSESQSNTPMYLGKVLIETDIYIYIYIYIYVYIYIYILKQNLNSLLLSAFVFGLFWKNHYEQMRSMLTKCIYLIKE